MIQSNTHETAAAIVLNGYCSGYFCCPDDAIWFKFTPTTTQYYTIYSTGYMDVKAQLYNSSLVYITQGDDEGPGDNFEITTELTANQTYYVKVTTFNSEGSFNIYVTADVQVEAVIIDPEFITLNNGSSINLTATVLPTYATNQDLYWQSGNTNVATVDSNGRVTAVGGGETCICAYSQDGSNKYGCCRVVVPVYATDMKLQTSGNIAYMTQPFIITPKFTPYNTTNKAVTWCSSDPSIAEMGSNGKLITYKPGNVKITAVSHDGSFSDSIDIRVVYDKITIMNDDYYNKVVFEYSNKEWLCLSKDIIYTETDPYYDEDVVRGHKNYHVRYQWGQYAEGVKEYTNDELKMLYVIDPHGVAFYIQKYADLERDSLEESIQYKDEKFEALFGRQPKHFIRNSEGIWEETTDLRDMTDVFSESELLFGTHPIWDDLSDLALADLLLVIPKMVIGLIVPDEIQFLDVLIETFIDVLKYSVLRALDVEVDFWDAVEIDEWGTLSSFKSEESSAVMGLLSVIMTYTEIIEASNELREKLLAVPSYKQKAIQNFIEQTNYYIFAKLNNGQTFVIEDSIARLN